MSQSVRELDAETSVRRLHASYAADDTVRFFSTRTDAALVSSKSKPGTWHFATESSCDCEHFRFTLTPCRHMARASYELALRRHARSSNDFRQVGSS